MLPARVSTAPALPVKPLRPGAIVVQALFAAFLLWLYVGDLIRFFRAQAAPVTMLNELPSLGLSLVGTVVALAFTGTLVLVAARRQPRAWRPRDFSIAAALFLVFIDFVILSAKRSPISAESRLLMAIQSVADDATRAAAIESVPRDPNLLRSFLEGVGAVPLFVEGERVPEWKLELRERCTGPALEPGSATPGTLIYCVAGDRKRAWVTLVGTTLGQSFGAPAIVSTEGDWVGEVVAAAPPEEPAGPPVWGPPTPEEQP